MIDARSAAAALCGKVVGRDKILCPGPGHSLEDRSLSILVDPAAPDGFVCNSFSGDDPIQCKDYVRSRLGLPGWEPTRHVDAIARMNERQRRHDRNVVPMERKPFNDARLLAAGYTNVAQYDYTDERGELLYQVQRYEHPTEKKTFLQRSPNGRGGWFADAGKRKVLYRWNDLAKVAHDQMFVCEGEKDADRLASLGFLAVTVASGAWSQEAAEALRGYDCYILEDNDESGGKKAADSADALRGIARAVRIVRLPGLGPKQDVSDWLDGGNDPGRLLDIARAAPIAGPADGGADMICLADVDMEALDWLWPDRFALGKFGLVAGLPDEGKGQILADMAARISTGAAWPCNEGVARRGSVILLTAEDDLADTVKPRLMAAGADMSRIHVLRMVKDGGRNRMFNLCTDLAVLRREIERLGDVVQVQIDPISAYLGVGKVDSYRTTDVRAVLAPLVDMAGETHTSVVGIMHFNKKVDVTNALLRISDSLAFGATARHVFAAVDDPENQRKLLVRGKNNLARADIKALSYGFGCKKVGFDQRLNKDITAPHVVWFGHVDVTASEAMQAATEQRAPSARDDAKKFLAEFLAHGPVSSAEVEEAAKANGISRRTLFRVKGELGIRATKTAGCWTWQLPDKGSNSEECQP